MSTRLWKRDLNSWAVLEGRDGMRQHPGNQNCYLPFPAQSPSVPSGHNITGYIGRDICIECSPVTWSPYNETKDYKTEMICHGSYSCMTSQDQWVQHVWRSAIMQFKVRSQGAGRDLQRGAQKTQGPCNVPVPRSACSIRILWTSVNKMCLHHFNIMARNLWRWGLESCLWNTQSDF